MEDALKNLYEEIQCEPKKNAGHPFFRKRHTLLANEIKGLKSKFDSGDRMAFLEAINLSFRNGFTMPQWAHKEISEAITNYFQDHGKNSLDYHLSIKPGRGRAADPFSKTEQKAFKDTVTSMIVFLNRFIDFSLPICFEIIAERGVEKGILPNEKSRLVYLSADTLSDIYKIADSHYKTEEISRIKTILKNIHPYELFKDDFEDAFLKICKKKHLKKEILDKANKQRQTLITQFNSIQNRPTRWPGA